MGDSELRMFESSWSNREEKNKINHVCNWWCACWHKRARREIDLNEWNCKWRQGRGDTVRKIYPNLSLLQSVPVFNFSTDSAVSFFWISGQLPFPCARMFPWEPLNTTPQFFTLKIWSGCKEIERICRLLPSYQLFWHNLPHELSWKIL